MSPLLISSDVSPFLNITENAWSKVGEISFLNSWKNSVGMPSHPGALPFGIAEMASWTSFRVSSLINSMFVSFETRVGVLAQQASRAFEVQGTFTSEV